MEDTIKVNLQEFVLFVDLLLELVGDLESLRKVGDIGVDKDGVGVSIYDLCLVSGKAISKVEQNLHLTAGFLPVHEYASRSLDP